MCIDQIENDTGPGNQVVVHPSVLELKQLEAELEQLNTQVGIQPNQRLRQLGVRIGQLHQELQMGGETNVT